MNQYKLRRCQLGIHNYTNFMDSSIHPSYHLDVPNEVMKCQVCGILTLPREILEREQYEDNHEY